MNNGQEYYRLYEDRYRRVHDQGFEYWNPMPDKTAEVLAGIDAFLDYAGCVPEQGRIIEFGCGEGFVAEHLLGRGFRYLGVDISESAIRTARERTGEKGADSFMQADVVKDMDRIPEKSYDAAIDNQCLHMLVTDGHRHKYLSEIRRILKPGGMVFFRENIQEEEFTDAISGFQDWLEKTGNDYTELHDYPAYKDNARNIVKLPRVPARFNNETGYRMELEEASFRVDYFTSDGWQCVIYAGLG